jgi:hypothetical protein
MTVFAFDKKFAVSLVVGFDNGFHPWWGRTRAASLKWRASSELEIAAAPGFFSSDGGWWTDVSGVVSALPALGCEAVGKPMQPLSVVRDGAFEVEWTATMPHAQLGEKAAVKSIVFPARVTAVGERALAGFEALESVVFRVNCKAFGSWAFGNCESLKAVSLPAGCQATGYAAFWGCSSLASITIPSGCTTISDYSLRWCSALTSVQIPKGCHRVGHRAFVASALEQVVIPDGCQIGQAALMSCRSLTTVRIGTVCAMIECEAFSGCTALATVTLPSTLQSIGMYAFEDCRAPATIVIPKSCHVDMAAFHGSGTRVMEL